MNTTNVKPDELNYDKYASLKYDQDMDGNVLETAEFIGRFAPKTAI